MGAAMNERPVDGQNRDRLRRNGANPDQVCTKLSARAFPQKSESLSLRHRVQPGVLQQSPPNLSL